MKKNFELVIFISLFTMILLSSIVASYAYFTARSNADLQGKNAVTSATTGKAYATGGSKISFKIKKEDMTYENINTLEPIATAKNDQPITFKIETNDNGDEINCVYDLVYIPEIPYYNSPDNVDNVFELTLKGNEEKEGIYSFEEISLGNVDTLLVLKKDVEIATSGINAEKEHLWIITAGYYNQDLIQDENAYQKFSAKIEINNIRCEH